MKTYQVEKGIPFPEDDTAELVEVRSVFPWPLMRVGDSFFVPFAHGGGGRVHAAVKMRNRRHPETRFAARRVNGGWRIWRTA